MLMSVFVFEVEAWFDLALGLGWIVLGLGHYGGVESRMVWRVFYMESAMVMVQSGVVAQVSGLVLKGRHHRSLRRL
jgi:hypothetical protein